jgi:glyoxalase family protein
MRLALTETEPHADHAFTPWAGTDVPEAYQLRALSSVRLVVRNSQPTAAFLSRAYGFEKTAEDGQWSRYTVGDGAGGRRIDLRVEPGAPAGRWGVGSVHHVAFRVAGDEEQRTVRRRILDAGSPPTDVIDRFWFKSVYTREPSGVICEVATDGPGFAVDEDPDHLGETLVLPPWYESRREAIASQLPPVSVPTAAPPTPAQPTAAPPTQARSAHAASGGEGSTHT